MYSAFSLFLLQTPPSVPNFTTTPPSAWDIVLKAIQQIVEQDLKGVLTGVVITLWFVYRYSNLPKELEELIDKVDKIGRRQKLIIESLNSVERRNGGIGKNIIDSEETTGEL